MLKLFEEERQVGIRDGLWEGQLAVEVEPLVAKLSHSQPVFLEIADISLLFPNDKI